MSKEGQALDVVVPFSHKGHIEPKNTYLRRCFFISFVLLALTTLMLFTMVISLFYILKSINQIHARYKVTIETAIQNGHIMRLMNNFPYSKFMLSEARDCPICFEQFKDDCQVV